MNALRTSLLAAALLVGAGLIGSTPAQADHPTRGRVYIRGGHGYGGRYFAAGFHQRGDFARHGHRLLRHRHHVVRYGHHGPSRRVFIYRRGGHHYYRHHGGRTVFFGLDIGDRYGDYYDYDDGVVIIGGGFRDTGPYYYPTRRHYGYCGPGYGPAYGGEVGVRFFYHDD